MTPRIEAFRAKVRELQADGLDSPLLREAVAIIEGLIRPEEHDDCELGRMVRGLVAQQRIEG